MLDKIRRSAMVRSTFPCSIAPAMGLALTGLCLALPSLVCVQPAGAQEAGDSWQFTVAPYIMGASLDGTMTVGGLSAELDVSASEVFESLKIGFMAMGMARKGNWGIAGDMIWAELGITSDRPRAEVDPTTGIFTLNAMRRLNAFADATAGVRWTHVGSSIEFLPPLDAEAEQTKDWVDPIIGVLLHTPGESRWHATLMADIGGFGVSSDFVWQLSPFVGYDVADWGSVEIGWRFIDTDYTTGEGRDEFAYDVLMQGPAGGFAFRF